MSGELRPSACYKKGHALPFFKTIRSRTIHHQRAAGTERFNALDLETGAGDLRIHDDVGGLILARQHCICDTADVEHAVGVSADLLRDGADDSQGGGRHLGQDGRPGLGKELPEAVYLEGVR